MDRFRYSGAGRRAGTGISFGGSFSLVSISMAFILAFFGAAAIFLWGAGHLIATRSVVSGFGELTTDNSRIITMEWLAEGLTLCFIGVLSALVTLQAGVASPTAIIVLRACAGMLLVLAVVSAFTGARTSVLPMKLCPMVKSAVAALFVAATLLA